MIDAFPILKNQMIDLSWTRIFKDGMIDLHSNVPIFKNQKIELHSNVPTFENQMVDFHSNVLILKSGLFYVFPIFKNWLTGFTDYYKFGSVFLLAAFDLVGQFDDLPVLFVVLVDYVDIDYSLWLSWLLMPLLITFLLPAIIVLLFYLSAIIFHIYKLYR